MAEAGRTAGEGGRNLARFFVEHRPIAWVLLAAAIAWGAYGYLRMPKRKDPEIPVRVALAVCPWPGMTAARVEQLVTRRLEEAISGNSAVDRIESTTRESVSVVLAYLREDVADTLPEFSDIGERLAQLHDMPRGAGPITWVSDFGDTAALMLTVASPNVGRVEVELRGRALRAEIERVRAGAAGDRVSALYCVPAGAPARGGGAAVRGVRGAGGP